MKSDIDNEINDSLKKLRKAEDACFPQFEDGKPVIWLNPAYSIRKDPDNGGDYGNHGVEICFGLRIGNRAVTTTFFTPFMPTEDGIRTSAELLSEFPRLTCTGLYYHYNKKPRNSEERLMRVGECDIFANDGKCWGEAGSALYGDEISKMLINGGSAAVFKELKRALRKDFRNT